jgi:DNA-binding NarL/FixJ family response regulator
MLHPHTAVRALTMYEDEQYFLRCSTPALSAIPKRAAPDDLVSAIAGAEGNVFHPRWRAPDPLCRRRRGPEEGEEVLTAREREVLTCIAEGMTNREIAEALVISIKTVERHRENIMAKLDMHNRVELVKYAIKKGLIAEQ